MVKWTVAVLSIALVVGTSVGVEMFADTFDAVSVWRGCDGTVVVRSTVGKLEITKQAPNLPDCVGPKVTEIVSAPQETVEQAEWVTSTGTQEEKKWFAKKEFHPENGPLLDLAQTDIVKYRREQMRQDQIRYANAIRSVRMRAKTTKKSDTVAYLIKNDAVVIEGKETGWVKTTGAEVHVSDTRENIVTAYTGGKATGYIASRYLRTPTSSDLVRIGQADPAYWSDLVHVNVAHLVNVRANPWYGAKIITTLSNQTNLYVISTVDNWSEVISEDKTIHGFIRSDYLITDKSQRVEPSPFL